MGSTNPTTDIEEAFERGRAVGRVEGLAFEGVARIVPWTLGAQFRVKSSWFLSYVDYEREVLEDLRRVQRARSDEQTSIRDHQSRVALATNFAKRAPQEARDLPWIQRRWLLWSRPWLNEVTDAESMLADSQSREAMLRTLEQSIADQLSRVAAAVDVELEEGRGRACVVDAMRRVPNRPSGVREYRDVREFVLEDPRRALPTLRGETDAGGEDFGSKWRLEDPVRRWNTTRWRVSWLYDTTHELYAIEYMKPHLPNGPPTDRVWLLGVLHDRADVDHLILELETYAQRERNSLVALAHAVSAACAARRVRSEPSSYSG